VIAAALLIAALALRVADVQSTAYRPVNDARSYLKLANEIANTGDYSSRDAGAGGTRGPSAYFPPGYPYFLGAVDLLDGHLTGGSSAVHPARVAQALLGTVTVALIGLVAFELFGSTVALIALALAAVYPVLIELSGVLVAENLLVALELAAVWATLRARRARRAPAWIAAAGVLCGLATLTHVNGALLLIPVALAVWTARPRWAARALAAPGLLIAAAALTVAPWTIRNAIVMHSFIPVSDETGITLVGTYNPASAAYGPVPYKWRIYSKIPQDASLARRASQLTEADLGGQLLSQAVRYIRDHPTVPVAVAYHNTLRLLELEGSYAWHASALAMGLSESAAEIGVLGFWIVCALALLGIATPAARRAPGWVWWVPIVFALSVVVVNVETPRFRAPIDPFLILLAACALGALAEKLRRTPVRRDERPAMAAAGEPVEVIERLT
jgi:4-amino-4-deoxy-L-arabinose transferase-like glycosyltransferase